MSTHLRWSTFKKVDGNAATPSRRQAARPVDQPSGHRHKGNSHMLMQDKNSDAIAEVIQKWLVGKNLSD
jgi:hypothetical protein